MKSPFKKSKGERSPRFQQGDAVRVIKSEKHPELVGKTALILLVLPPDSAALYGVSCIDNGFFFFAQDSDEFELVLIGGPPGENLRPRKPTKQDLIERGIME